MTFARACVIATVMMLCTSPSSRAAPPAPDAGKPDVAALLFENSQWSKAPPGTTITYAYSKKTSAPSFGSAFDDKIVETIEPNGSGDTNRRSVVVRMFSGANAKPAGPFDAEAQNPVLLLVMEENVQELSKLFHGNVRYLKNAIRKAWRDDARIEPTTVNVDGKSVPGTRIIVTPFAQDAEKGRMMGLEGMAYIVEIADSVPGQIVNIIMRAPDNDTPKFSETLRYVAGAKP